MDWPFNYPSTGRPRAILQIWTLTYLALILGFLEPFVKAESSPPVADVEDLFKDEGFLRMSRGGEAFGRRPPPPPLILSPPHFSTQPPRVFPTNSPKDSRTKAVPPLSSRNDQSGEKISLENINSNLANRSRNGGGGINADEDQGGGKSKNGDSGGQQPSKPLQKDVNAVFSKVGQQSSSGGGPSSGGDLGADSEHPLLGITPAAPGEAFDFNPILSNPAVTRILAGSSGRIPQWEPTLPDLHDLIPEVNYTADPSSPRGYTPGGSGGSSSYNPTTNKHQIINPSQSGSQISNGNNNGLGTPMHNPKNPVFVPSPVSSRGSATMYNMDQLTNNIAIPKHTLPNPSNLATSRSTIIDDRGDNNHHGENSQGGLGEERDNHHDRYSPNSSGSNNHLDESRGDGAGNPFTYDDEDSGLNEDSAKNYMGTNPAEAQGKRGIWKGEPGQNGQELDSRDENGPKYIVCDALCGAWKHQCKLMGILFSITSVLCLVLAFVVLYSLHFSLRDFAPFSVILLFLFTASASRAFILLGGWFCSPDSRPTWLPIVSVLPSTFFVITFLVALHLARFPFPFIKSFNTIPYYVIFLISLAAVVPPLTLSIGAHFHPPSHGVLTQVAWILAHVMLILVSLVYLFKFKPFYSRLANERGSSGNTNGTNGTANGPNGITVGGSASGTNGNYTLSSLKKRGFVVKWGCLQARAMFGAALLALTLSTMIIISVSMSRGECETASTWTGWVLSLCARMLEFAVVILLLVVTIFSVDIRFLRLTRVPINKTNVGLMNGDIYPTMVSSNTAVQRCIPMYSSNARADVMMVGPTERNSLRGKTFGERTLPGERLGEYRASTGRGLPLRLGSGPSHSLPGTPVDGFPQGFLKLPEPAPASLLVTKVVFGTPAVSREVNHNHSHQHENPLLCTGGSKDDRETNNIYASLESVKIAPFVNAGSSTGSNHSGSDRVLLSAPRDYIYSISRDLTKTIDSIYDASRPRGGNNLAHTIETLCPPLAHTIDQIGSIPNLSGNQTGRGAHFNFHPHSLHHPNGGSLTPGRTDLARTIDRIRYAAAAGGPHSAGTLTAPANSHPGRNFVLQLGNSAAGSNHIPGLGNPPPYCSSESSHDITPDSGIVSDIHSKSGRMDPSENVYSRDYKRSSVEDVRRLPLLPISKHRIPGQQGSLYDRTPTSPTNLSSASTPTAMHQGTSPLYLANQQTQNNSNVRRVEHLLNQTEHILSRTESLDSNSLLYSAGIQRLVPYQEQLEQVERLLAQAEYAIWLEKKTAQQVSHQATDPPTVPYGYGGTSNNVPTGFPSANSMSAAQCKESITTPTSLNNSMVVNNHGNSKSNCVTNSGTSSSNTNNQNYKKISKTLEEESVV